jgi:taurine---2-oxoglutarate transaminase
MSTVQEPVATASKPTTSHVLTPWSKQRRAAMPTMVRGEGAYLIDDQERRYLDLSAGLVAVNLGHAHPRVVDAIKRQAERLCYAMPAFPNDERDALAQRLSRLSPWEEGARTFFTTGGAEANEDAIKMARTITGRHKIIATYRSFHGSAPGAGTLTGEDRRWANEPGMPGVVRAFAPYPYRSPFNASGPAETEAALAHLDLVLTFEGPRNVAALIIEPVVGTNGVIPYPDGYLQGIRDITARHGILLIFDEVMTGFGRIGDRFAAVRYGVQPDIITMAKGLTSAYIPLGGAMLRESLAQHFDDTPLMCGHTYSGHPLAVATANAVLATMEDEGLFTRAREIDTWIRTGLDALAAKHEVIGDVRGIGAFYGVELVRDRATKEPLTPWYGGVNTPMERLMGALRARGVYAFGRYNVLLVTPPLTIARDELEHGLDVLDDALTNTDLMG